MLLASGRFPVSKAIIPEAQEHFLTPSAHRDTHIFGGLGLTPQGEYVDLGGYATMVHKHELDREMELNVKFSENTMVRMADEQASTMEIGMTFHPDAVRQRSPVLHRINYRMHSEDWQPLDINLRRAVPEADEDPDLGRGSHSEVAFEWDADVEALEDFVRNVCEIVAKRKREQDDDHQSHALMQLRNLQLELFLTDRADNEPAEPVSILEAVKRSMVSNAWSFMPNVTNSFMNSRLAPIHRRYECRGVLKG